MRCVCSVKPVCDLAGISVCKCFGLCLQFAVCVQRLTRSVKQLLQACDEDQSVGFLGQVLNSSPGVHCGPALHLMYENCSVEAHLASSDLLHYANCTVKKLEAYLIPT